MCEQRAMTRSGAPLITSTSPLPSSFLWMDSWYLLVELKGISNSFSLAARISSMLRICCTNLMMADSDASPMAAASRMDCTGSLGLGGWPENTARLHSTPQRWKARKVGESLLYDPLLTDVSVVWISPLNHRCATVMRFCVSVPVLSEQMVVVDPSVSTDSRFFTSTFFACMRLAVRVRATVTVASRPSGTLATMIPITNTMFFMMGYTNRPKIKKMMPRTMATAEIILMKW
mmetsp:Transcript_39307/g.99063  ORF Transcript_39307/g.99063 Transcript_39307/m.99063 type:complete len:232 (-) Transcript_39307:998-1693(-)